MEMPQELEVWYILPAVRREIAKSLYKKGLSQKDIAKRLKITEPAISQYIKAKRGKTFKIDKVLLKEVDISANHIDKDHSTANIIYEMNRISNLIKKSGAICSLHRNYDKDPSLEECDICMR